MQQRRPAVCVIGDAFVDIQPTPLPSLPDWGVDVLVDGIRILPGGSAVNTGRHLGSLSKEGSWITKLFVATGDDDLGRFLSRKLQEEGLVDTSGLQILRGVPQASCIILPGSSGAQSRSAYVSCLGSCLHVSHELLARENNVQHIHLAGYFQAPGIQTPEFLDLLRRFKKQGATISLDPQNDATGKWTGKDGHLRQLLQLVDYFMPNDTELAPVMGCASLDEAISAFAQLAPHAHLILKCGAEGVKAYGPDTRLSTPAIPNVQVVDTTGAGDAFNAGFLYYLLSGRNLATALRAGCAAGALVVQELGACTTPLRDSAIQELLRKLY